MHADSSTPAIPVAPGISNAPANGVQHTLRIRVRYSETDQMGTFYNSRPLEWFECGRTELFRELGLPYAELERRGLYLPLVEAHVEYLGRARYDDPLDMTSRLSWPSRASLRSDVDIRHVDTRKPIVRGYTIHAFTDPQGRAIRPPAWFKEALTRAAQPLSPSTTHQSVPTHR
jgi:acyl-CoA thioester hydrolase